MTNIYVLYDNSIETTESLDNFNKILKSKFQTETIVNISLNDYKTYLEQGNPFYNYVICINQTYKEINKIYSQKLDVPIFDFFGKEYVNVKENIVLFGLLLSVATIYEPSYKKYSWGVITRFHKEVVDHTPTEQVCDYLSETIEDEDKNEVKTIEVLAEPIKEEVLEVVETSSTNVTIIQPTYEELLDFYTESQKLLLQFHLVQDLFKNIESKSHE